MKLYHFTKSQNLMPILNGKRLKLSNLDDLNDPFEFNTISSKKPELREALRRTKAKITKEVGFVCFCEGFFNPVMWAHYADRHRGVCLEFDINDSYLFKVPYQERRNGEGLLKELLKPEASLEFKKKLYAKSNYWAYEKEHRIWLKTDHQNYDESLNMHFAEFDENIVLRKILLGYSFDGNLNALRDFNNKDLSIRVEKVRPAFQTFNMVVDRSFKL